MLGQTASPLGKVRFGPYELDCVAGELRKSGIRIRLQPQPFNILVTLIEHSGEVVGKQVLHDRVWGTGTAVDLEHGLGTAINKIREALGDSAEFPRYIETVPKRGYRFLAPVQLLAGDGPGPQRTDLYIGWTPTVSNTLEGQARQSLSRRALVLRGTVSAAVLALLAAAAYLLWPEYWGPSPVLRVSQVTRLSTIDPGDLTSERLTTVGTDGSRVYFSEIRGGQVVLSQSSVAEGETYPVAAAAGINRPALADVSRDGQSLLVRSLVWSRSDMEQPLWVIPTAGGAARRVPGVLAHDAAWLPDGRSITYASGYELWTTRSDGGAPRKLTTLPGRAYWIRYSPDGSRLRFTLVDPKTRETALWELSADGQKLSPLLPRWSLPPSECCGSWTTDGSHFVFQSSRDGNSDIWVLRERGWRSQFRRSEPTRLTHGPLDYFAPVPAGEDRLFVIGSLAQSQLFKFDASTGKFVRFVPEISSASRTEFSPDGRRMAWRSAVDRSLWQSTTEGKERVQLIGPPFRTAISRWSPDGSKLAVMARRPGEPWQIYLVPSSGGAPERLLDEPYNQSDPTWSADGRSIAFGRLPEHMADDRPPRAIYLVDLQSRKTTSLPDSEGLFSPRWSPDGRYIAALALDQLRLVLFDLATKKWTELVNQGVRNPVWSRDSGSIFFSAYMESDAPILRLSLKSRRIDRVADAMSVQPARLEFWGLAPDDTPVVSLTSPAGDIFVIDRTPGTPRR